MSKTFAEELTEIADRFDQENRSQEVAEGNVLAHHLERCKNTAVNAASCGQRSTSYVSRGSPTWTMIEAEVLAGLMRRSGLTAAAFQCEHGYGVSMTWN